MDKETTEIPGVWVGSDFVSSRLGITIERLDEAADGGLVRRRADAEGSLYALVDVDRWIRTHVSAEPLVVRGGFDTATFERQLQRANYLSQVGTMAMSVGHEINNPLTYVLSNNEYIRVEVLPQLTRLSADDPEFLALLSELGVLLDEMEEGAGHIRQVVAELAGMSRPEAGTSRSNPEGTISSAIRMAGPALNSSVSLTTEISVDRPLHVPETLLAQVLINLITNAVHAVQGIIDPKVTIRCFEESGSARVEVSDNGAGIRPDLVERVFDPFFTTKPLGEGTGLGLAVCRKLVENMGGTMTLTSEAGIGTTVGITLPLAEEEPPVEASAVRLSDIAGCTLLIVDDEPAVLRSLERMLASAGLELTLETSSRAALDRITQTDFDLILCDLMMPSMTGMALYRAVMSRKPEMCSRFVFISGGASSEEARAFGAAHFQRLLAKPVNSEVLLRALVDRHLAPVERLGPCPNIHRCPMFPKFQSQQMLGIYQVTYCEPTDGTYRHCARYRSMKSGVRPSPRLLPHGEELPEIT